MGGSHLLPWWGWLLVLQGLLWASLVEYVARHVGALQVANPAAPTPALGAAQHPGLAKPATLSAPTPIPQELPPIPVGLMTAPRPQPTPAPAFTVNMPNLYPADYEAWDHVDPLTLRQAACLWVNRDPAHFAMFALDGPGAGRLQALMQAAAKATLEANGGAPIRETGTVSREELSRSRQPSRGPSRTGPMWIRSCAGLG